MILARSHHPVQQPANTPTTPAAANPVHERVVRESLPGQQITQALIATHPIPYAGTPGQETVLQVEWTSQGAIKGSKKIKPLHANDFDPRTFTEEQLWDLQQLTQAPQQPQPQQEVEVIQPRRLQYGAQQPATRTPGDSGRKDGTNEDMLFDTPRPEEPDDEF